MRRHALPAILSALLLVGGPVLAQEASFDPVGGPWGRSDSLLALLDEQDPARLRELEAHYRDNADPEKRLLEKRFGLIEHRYRVDADPRGISRRWRAEGLEGEALERAVLEVVAGRYSAYYFFDGVIRPNVFAPPRFTKGIESALHEKVHLVQPALYRSLGLRCAWRRPDDPCVRSLEPVAVYLTEFARLKRASPSRTDRSVNRAIESWLAMEAQRCDYPKPVSRCPDAERVREYVNKPLDLARKIDRLGLEEGIRRFVEGLASGDLAGLAP
ncbi:MAG: hypothetical protein ACREMK_10575 [Gemmatimonadota bacterium]